MTHPTSKNDTEHLMLALVQQEGVLNECEVLLREALADEGVDAGFSDRLEAYWKKSAALGDWRTRDLLISGDSSALETKPPLGMWEQADRLIDAMIARGSQGMQSVYKGYVVKILPEKDFFRPSQVETSAPFGVCSKCQQPITSVHNISGCPADKASAELPESLRDPIKNLERGRELLDKWGPTPVTDAALKGESPLARAVRIARGDTGPPTEPVHFSNKACACRCHTSSGTEDGPCIYCGHSPENGKGES